tara:strand:+ start:6292 stop:6492 length:201 start_codon:yes stop_codon:yes gene_type:complete
MPAKKSKKKSKTKKRVFKISILKPKNTWKTLSHAYLKSPRVSKSKTKKHKKRKRKTAKKRRRTRKR